MNDKITCLENTIDNLQKENTYLRKLLNKHHIKFDIESVTRENLLSVAESTLSPQDKIKLYQTFFKGRNDVYAIRWGNQKPQKSGYVPACENEWHQILCKKKPAIKCSSCLNQK